MTRWIVDTSVWSRLDSDPVIARRVEALQADRSSTLLGCPPLVLEYCYMARSPAEFESFHDAMLRLAPARHHPMVEDVTDIQRALFDRGMGRAAGPVDILTAAYARLNDAVVVAADHDYDSIARVVRGFEHEFVQPTGR